MGIPLRLGISRCLLGENVRYDGGNKRNGFLVDVLGKGVEWVPICPEVEAGLGMPREPMHLEKTKLIGNVTGTDFTEKINSFSQSRINILINQKISGFVFKSNSPSCGIHLQQGQGLFVRALIEKIPFLPIEEEGRLGDPEIREQFLENVKEYSEVYLKLPTT